MKLFVPFQIFLALLVLCVDQVDAHVTRTGYCFTEAGDLRVWLRTYSHGTPGSGDTVDVSVDGVVSTLPSTGYLNLGAVYPTDQQFIDAGCTGPMTFVSECAPSNSHVEWAYFDFPIPISVCAQNLPFEVTIVSGNNQYFQEWCSAVYPASASGVECPADLCEAPQVFCPAKGKGRSRGTFSEQDTADEDEDEDEDSPDFPICTAKMGKGKIPTMQYKTKCINDEELFSLENPEVSSGRGSKLPTAFECGCCDPALEGEKYPKFCHGPPICDGAQVACDLPEEGRRLSSSTVRRTRSRGGKGKKAGVAICAQATDLCVEEYDAAYLGEETYTCGACF